MQYLEQFYEMLIAEKALSKNSVAAYKSDLTHFANILAKQKIALPSANASDIRGYITLLGKQSISARSSARKLSSIRSYYDFLISEQIITNNPTSNVELPRYSKASPKILTVEDIKQLINSLNTSSTPEDIRIKAMIHLLYASGMRVSELVSLKLSSLRIDHAKQQISNHFTISGKGNKERMVIISQSALGSLTEYLEHHQLFIVNEKSALFLFPSPSASGHMTRQNFALLLKKAANGANIPTEKISPHIIRHSFASHLLKGGADLRVIQELLGHSNISTTQIYTHVANKHLADTVAKFHPLERFK